MTTLEDTRDRINTAERMVDLANIAAKQYQVERDRLRGEVATLRAENSMLRAKLDTINTKVLSPS